VEILIRSSVWYYADIQETEESNVHPQDSRSPEPRSGTPPIRLKAEKLDRDILFKTL